MLQAMKPLVHFFSLLFLTRFPFLNLTLANDQKRSLYGDEERQPSDSTGTKSGQTLVEKNDFQAQVENDDFQALVEHGDFHAAATLRFKSINSQPAFVELDYNSGDTQWQRNQKKGKRRNKPKSNRVWRTKNGLSNKQKQKWKGQRKRTLQGNRGKYKRKNGKNKGKIKNRNLGRRKLNWGGGKSRNLKREMRTIGKGRKSPKNRKQMPNRKGGKGEIGKVNLALLRQIHNKEQMMRYSILNSHCHNVVQFRKALSKFKLERKMGMKRKSRIIGGEEAKAGFSPILFFISQVLFHFLILFLPGASHFIGFFYWPGDFPWQVAIFQDNDWDELVL